MPTPSPKSKLIGLCNNTMCVGILLQVLSLLEQLKEEHLEVIENLYLEKVELESQLDSLIKADPLINSIQIAVGKKCLKSNLVIFSSRYKWDDFFIYRHFIKEFSIEAPSF